MYDYMKALHLRFENHSKQARKLEQTVNSLHRQLASRLGKKERKMLLWLTDLEDALRDQTNLDSFMSGFRLASGINQELMEEPPYSFAREEEERACRKAQAQDDDGAGDATPNQ